MKSLAGWNAEQLIFIDEAAANDRTGDRKYGWVPVGATPHVSRPLQRSERWSLLPAYTIDDFFIWEIAHGSFTAKSFENFIEKRGSSALQPLSSPMVCYCHGQCSSSSIRRMLMFSNITDI
jgi:hypothetical protein